MSTIAVLLKGPLGEFHTRWAGLPEPGGTFTHTIETRSGFRSQALVCEKVIRAVREDAVSVVYYGLTGSRRDARRDDRHAAMALAATVSEERTFREHASLALAPNPAAVEQLAALKRKRSPLGRLVGLFRR